MTFRLTIRDLAVLALLAGLLLRAATPLGYMPGSAGSGLMFELCPGQLPAGFVLPGATSGHEHHHHATGNEAPAEPDTCQLGHLLSSAAVVGEFDSNEPISFEPPVVTARPAARLHSAAKFVGRSRDPPA